MFNMYGEFDMRAMSGVTDKPLGNRSAIASSPTQEEGTRKPQQKPLRKPTPPAATTNGNTRLATALKALFEMRPAEDVGPDDGTFPSCQFHGCCAKCQAAPAKGDAK